MLLAVLLPLLLSAPILHAAGADAAPVASEPCDAPHDPLDCAICAQLGSAFTPSPSVPAAPIAAAARSPGARYRAAPLSAAPAHPASARDPPRH